MGNFFSFPLLPYQSEETFNHSSQAKSRDKTEIEAEDRKPSGDIQPSCLLQTHQMTSHATPCTLIFSFLLVHVLGSPAPGHGFSSSRNCYYETGRGKLQYREGWASPEECRPPAIAVHPGTTSVLFLICPRRAPSSFAKRAELPPGSFHVLQPHPPAEHDTAEVTLREK